VSFLHIPLKICASFHSPVFKQVNAQQLSIVCLRCCSNAGDRNRTPPNGSVFLKRRVSNVLSRDTSSRTRVRACSDLFQARLQSCRCGEQLLMYLPQTLSFLDGAGPAQAFPFKCQGLNSQLPLPGPHGVRARRTSAQWPRNCR
jgi:hypothetical protein